MGVKEDIKKALRLRAETAEKKLDDMPVNGSRFYHQYFEGYSERRGLTGESGKVAIERIYTGKYFTVAGGKKAFRLRKLGYSALCILSLAALLAGIRIHVPSNYSKLSAVPGLCSLVGWLFLLASLVRYDTRPYKMKHWDYNCGPKKILLYGCITAALMAANCIVSVIFLVTGGPDTLGAEALALAFKLAATMLLGAVLLIEKRTAYRVLEDDYDDKHGWIKIT